ncbi:sulfite exporter TauE/SafE family protein [Clostridium hydrogeniformans]|uniref:sulfite exporter TauE/SafE family protein n=1 Tax=Clostridium hydrogeniformans TaxID=349933 RepID=UPI000482DF70|nr:sulfite exporter TauE/SafE family protein [Clostridium hydrogeniformans]
MTQVVFAILICITLYFGILFVKDFIKTKKEGKLEKGNFLALGLSGLITNFLGALGIGGFAILMAILRFFKLSEDKTLPGTLNVSCTIPVVVQAMIFITVIKVDALTLFSMLISAAIGAFVGAGIVSKFDEKKVQIGMGIALAMVALTILLGQLNLMPVGGTASGLYGGKLIFAVMVNFVLGALMTLGIGLVAPCMALVCALGMDPKLAFPIIMGSAAFVMPVASVKFVSKGVYDRKASMAITLFGLVGVFIAVYLVKNMNMVVLKWLVIVVLIYTSINMFRAAVKNKRKKATS